jgi:AcrR family transcriptional regulator
MVAALPACTDERLFDTIVCMAIQDAPHVMGNATKAALLEAAKRLVAERGYAGTSVRDLAAASGANLAAVSYHFGSKEALLNQAVEKLCLEWTDRAARVARTEPDAGPVEWMLASLSALLEEFPENESLFVAFLEGLLQARRSPELLGQVAGHYAEQRRRVGEIVTAGQGDREVPARMVEVVASLMIAVADGLLLQLLLDPAAAPTDDELSALAKGLAAGNGNGKSKSKSKSKSNRAASAPAGDPSR